MIIIDNKELNISDYEAKDLISCRNCKNCKKVLYEIECPYAEVSNVGYDVITKFYNEKYECSIKDEKDNSNYRCAVKKLEDGTFAACDDFVPNESWLGYIQHEINELNRELDFYEAIANRALN